MRYSEKWGDSIDAAVNLALQDLKLAKEQVKITVLEEPSKGFFGIGSKLAKVRVEELEPEKPAKAAKKDNSFKIGPVDPEKAKVLSEKVEKAEKEMKAEKANNPEAAEKKQGSKKKNKKPAPKKDVKVEINNAGVSTKPEGLVEVSEHPAKDFLEKTFKEMGIEVTVTVSVNQDNVYVDVEGKDTGTVIGKRGATLDSIQYLTSLVVNKSEDEHIRVIVDAEGYRAKREETLKKLAARLAEKVLKTGKSTRLEPMNPYERKVIHTSLQGVKGINTRSEGDEPYRRVVIELKK